MGTEVHTSGGPDPLLSCPRGAAQEPRALLRAMLPLPGAA